jgi:predicted dehydrogenase
MATIRLGIIGLGSIANGVHIPGILKSPDLELAAVCDCNPEVLQARKEQYHIDDAHCFLRYEDLIACEDVDVVDICTPNHVHFEIAMAAVRAGKAYSLEKPVTMSRQQAETLANATQQAQLPNMVCFSYRFKPAARYAKRLIEQGMIGKVHHVYAQYFQEWGLEECGTPLVWRFVKEKTGTGTLGDLGSHLLDLVRFLTGKEYCRLVSHAGTILPKRKNLQDDSIGCVDVDDYCHYLTEMQDGISATFAVSRFAYGRGNYQVVEIYGEKGALVYHLEDEDSIEACIGRAYASSRQFVTLKVPEDCRVEQMQSYADLIKGCGDGLAATIQDGLTNQKLLDAAAESAQQQRWIDVSM